MTTPGTEINVNIEKALKDLDTMDKTPPSPPQPLMEESVDKGSFLEKALTNNLSEEDIPDSMRRAFVRSVLGEGEFSHEFLLLDGRLAITYREPSQRAMEQYNRLSGRLEEGDIAAANALVTIFFLKTVTTPTQTMESPGELSGEEMVSAMGMGREGISEWAQNKAAAMFPVSASVSRMLPVLWMMFSYAWRFLVNNGLPRSF